MDKTKVDPAVEVWKHCDLCGDPQHELHPYCEEYELCDACHATTLDYDG